MEVPVGQPEERGDRQKQQEQLPVVVQQERGRTGQLAQQQDAEEEHLLQAAAHRLDVGDHPAENAPELRLMKVVERHPLQVRKEIVAQVMDHGLAQLELVALPEVDHERREQEQGEKSSRFRATVAGSRRAAPGR